MNTLININYHFHSIKHTPRIKVPRKTVARALKPSDYLNFKAARLRALKEEGQYFSSTYEHEASLPDEYWIKKCTPTKDSSYFGLFDGTKIIGAMYAEKWDRDPTGMSAYWGAAYVMPEYRGTGVSKQLYKKRENWTKLHPTFNKCVLTLFDGNKRSEEIHKKRGAKYMFSETIKLSGQNEKPIHYYERKIHPKLRLVPTTPRLSPLQHREAPRCA